MLKNFTIPYTQLYTPTLHSQCVNTDIHAPRSECPLRPEIRCALCTRLYAPTLPLFLRVLTQAYIPNVPRLDHPVHPFKCAHSPTLPEITHTDIHTPRPECPEIRYALHILLFIYYIYILFYIRPLNNQMSHDAMMPIKKNI